MLSHSHNFENVIQDFPKEALERIPINIPARISKIHKVDFVHQETSTRQMSGANIPLNMHILITEQANNLDTIY
jgi:hypothetical protein